MGGTSDDTAGTGALPNAMRDYFYPDYTVYSAMRPGGKANLRHGVVFAVNSSTVDVAATDTSAATKQLYGKALNTKLNKGFQYNPSTIGFALGASDAAPASGDTPGGGAVKTAIGVASTAMELLFTRDEDVRAANSVQTETPRSKLFKTLGVQRDLIDLYRVLLGETPSVDMPSDASIAGMTGSMVDFAVAGAPILFGLCCFAFNDYLVVYGTVTDFSWEFDKFNYDLVPTWLKVRLSLGIYNYSSASTVDANVTGTGANTDAQGKFGGQAVTPGKPWPGLGTAFTSDPRYQRSGVGNGSNSTGSSGSW